MPIKSHILNRIFAIAILAISFCINNQNGAWGQDSSSLLKIVYPKSNSAISAPSTFIVGQVNPGATLTCNGMDVKVNKVGFFAHVVPLQLGANRFVLSSTNTNSSQHTNDTYDVGSNTHTQTNSTTSNSSTAQEELTVIRKIPPRPISPTEIRMEGLSPNVDLGVKARDTINFSVHATPSSNVTVQFGDHKLALTSYNGQAASGNSANVTYGKVVQSAPLNATKYSDVYKGTYRIGENDHFVGIHPKYTLACGSNNLSVTSKTTITTVDELIGARTTKDPTIVRIAPDLARTTPLVNDVRVAIDGWSGENMRCLYSPNRHVWIKKDSLIIDNDIHSSTTEPPTSAPQAVARTINLINNAYGEQLRLPLTESLPYQIEQKLNPNCLVLRVYGVSSDTDWITNELQNGTNDKQVIDHVTWKQSEDNVYEITVHLLGDRQWGYKIFYEGTTLCLDIKRSPITAIRPTTDTRLDGIKICLDPGHGGQDNGSVGCSGLPESQVNLDIALKTKTCLENLGATVIMTRTSQSVLPSLEDRVKLATDTQADFLISIHNNALPDGRDPLKEHGTSSYWYYPQSIELARCLKNAVKNASGFPDLGARYQNLALARAPAMPAVLLEIGFMINPDEFAQLIDPSFQLKISRAIVTGLEQYLNQPVTTVEKR